MGISPKADNSIEIGFMSVTLTREGGSNVQTILRTSFKNGPFGERLLCDPTPLFVASCHGQNFDSSFLVKGQDKKKLIQNQNSILAHLEGFEDACECARPVALLGLEDDDVLLVVGGHVLRVAAHVVARRILLGLDLFKKVYTSFRKTKY